MPDWKDLLSAFSEAFDDAVETAIEGITDEDRRNKVRAKVAKEATDALPKQARQHLISNGYAVGFEKGTGAKEDLQGQLDTTKESLEAAKKSLKDLREKHAQAADDEEVTRLRQREQELQDKIQQLQDDHTEALTAKDEAFATQRKDSFFSNAEAILERVHGVDAYMARARLLDPGVRKRLKVEDGQPVLYDDEGLVPVSVPSGQTPADVLAEEIVQNVDPKYIDSKVRSGSGIRGGANNGAGGDLVEQFRQAREGRRQKRTNPLRPQHANGQA